MTKIEMREAIAELQKRIVYLEGRTAILEQRRFYEYCIPPYIPNPYVDPFRPYWGDIPYTAPVVPDYAYWNDNTTRVSISDGTVEVL